MPEERSTTARDKRSASPREGDSIGLSRRAARCAIERSTRRITRASGRLLDPVAWAEHYPKTSVGVSAGLGLAAGTLVTWHLGRRETPDEPERLAEGAASDRVRARRVPRRAEEASGDDDSAAQALAWTAPLISLVRGAQSTFSSAGSAHKTAPTPPDGNVDEPTPAEKSPSRHETKPTARLSAPSGPGRIARLRDLVGTTLSSWWSDSTFRVAAALSYYTIFSLAPLLVLTIGVASVALERDAVESSVLDQFEGLVGAEGREFVGSAISRAQESDAGVLASAIGVAILLFGASGVFYQIQLALNEIWGVPARASGGLLRTLRKRLLSFTLVLGLGFLALVSLVFSAALAAFGDWLDAVLPLPEIALRVLHALVGLISIAALFAAIYKWLPDVRLSWREVGTGALVTSALFGLGKFAIGAYLGHAAFSSTYGAAASAMVVLVWAYYSALVFLLGAVFTYVYATRDGADARERRVS